MAYEIASAKPVIPWLFGALGVPESLTGSPIPTREAGVLLPQLAVAAAVRRLAIRKGIWVLGAIFLVLNVVHGGVRPDRKIWSTWPAGRTAPRSSRC